MWYHQNLSESDDFSMDSGTSLYCMFQAFNHKNADPSDITKPSLFLSNGLMLLKDPVNNRNRFWLALACWQKPCTLMVI